MHYLVERIESDALTTMRRVARQAAAPFGGVPMMRMPGPDPNRPLVLHEAESDEARRNARGDVVRIVDREGNVGWWREFVSRDAGLRKHSEIMDDLMKMDLASFRSKYSIIPERPSGVPAPAPAGGDASEQGGAPAPGSANDPSGPWADPLGAWRDRIAESEGGSDWKPGEPQQPSDPDFTWDDWGRR